MKQKVKVEGGRELQSALRALPDATAKNVLRRVGRKSLEPVADAASQLVRVDQGALKASIGVSTKLTRRQRRGRKKGGPNDIEIFAGAGGLVQAITEEFGTSDQSPHPFMRPAWDAHRRGVLEAVKTQLATEITKAAERLARKAAKLAKG